MTLLKSHVAKDCAHGNGRPGMTLWNLLVLATLKQGLNDDYDRSEALANEHRTHWRMLQHPNDNDLE